MVAKMVSGAEGLLDGGALLMVFLGGIAAVLVSFPLREVAGAWRLVGVGLFSRCRRPTALVERMVNLAETARRHGILALEKLLTPDEDPFLAQGVRLAVDGTEPELIVDILETELRFTEQRHQVGSRLMGALGRYWILFGVLGGLAVLVTQAPAAGAGLALVGKAALPLLYGGMLAGLVGLPFQLKLENRTQRELLHKRMIIEGIMAIQSGDNPRIVEHKLMVFLAPRQRRTEGRPATLLPPPPPQGNLAGDVERLCVEKKELVLDLVREAAATHGAKPEQKAAVEEMARRVERGEMPVVSLLARLGAEARQHVLQGLRKPPSPLLQEGASQEFGFEQISTLTDREIQTLLREVDQKDCVLALKGASDAVKAKVLGSMSERVRTFITEEMCYLHSQPEDVLMAQAGIVGVVLALAGRGQIELR